MEKTIKDKLLFIIAIFLIILAGFLYYVFMPRQDIVFNEISLSEAALTINFGDSKRSFAGETVEGMTVYDALLVSQEAGQLDIDFDRKEIKKINGVEKDDKEWNLYLNKEKVEDYFDQAFVNPGDRIELRLE